MRDSEVTNLVHATLAAHLHVSEQGVYREADLFDDLGADSLDVVELTLLFEEMFKVDISDDDLEQIRTVGQIDDLLKQKVSTRMIEEQNEQGRPADEDLTPVPNVPAEDEQPEADEADEGEGDDAEADGDGEEQED
jgi:acyl carrier protein